MSVTVPFPYYAGEYTAGTIITLRVHWADSQDTTGNEIDFEIVRTLNPFTHAVVCILRQVAETSNKTYFLKMYDRRFSNQLRDDPNWQSYGEHTPEREIAYQRYLIDADRPKFGFLDLDRDEMTDEDKTAYDAAFYPSRFPPDSDYVGPWSGITRFEILAARLSKMAYEHEQTVYRDLQAMGKTGTLAPRLLGTVEYSSPVGAMHGLLLEHIHNAITLRHYLRAAAPCGHLSSQVAAVCQMAWDARGDLTKDTPFFLDDVRHDDILVQFEDEWQIPDTLLERQYLPLKANMWKEPPTSANETTAILNAPRPRRCVIVDFELPRRRHPDENEFEWAMARAHDEEHGLLWFHLRSDLIGALYEDCKVHDTLCWSDLSLRTQENLFSRPEEELHPLPPLSRRERRMYYDSILIGQYWSRHEWYHLLPPPRGGRTEPIETDDEDSEEEDSESEESEGEDSEEGGTDDDEPEKENLETEVSEEEQSEDSGL